MQKCPFMPSHTMGMSDMVLVSEHHCDGFGHISSSPSPAAGSEVADFLGCLLCTLFNVAA